MSSYLHNSQIKLYNTLAAKLSLFEPLDRTHIRMYVCGPTVYDYIHIGNARPIVVFDTLFRLLKSIYPKVSYVRNITDIDDKIILASKKNNCSITETTDTYRDAFHQDIKQLNTLEPDSEPCATEYIEEMLAMVQTLINEGHAYVAEGHVLFEVSTAPAYGKLSKRSLDDIVQMRIEPADYKKHPADFILWKPSSDDQPGWNSPWGRGRPGWHLECSTMAKALLGNVIDIHGGGQDLVFPHHENEIVQSCCANGTETFANYWIHNGYITIRGEKMAKSLNNFLTLRDALLQYNGETIRYALLSTHYRKPINWSAQKLEEAQNNLNRIYHRLMVEQIDPHAMNREPQLIDPKVQEALCNDLNTPLAITRLHELLQSGQLESMVASAQQLGLLYLQPAQWFDSHTSDDTLDENDIEALIAERSRAREQNNYVRADEIRDQLSNAGICIEDSNQRTQWYRK